MCASVKSSAIGLAAVALLLAAVANAGVLPFECPLECDCFVETDAHGRSYNRAECGSLLGLAAHPQAETASIQTIDLSHIELAGVDHQLDRFGNLSHLILSHNRLTQIAPSLAALRLRSLFADHNLITSEQLANVPGIVQQLNLTHNRLTVLLPSHFRRLHRLHTIALAGNPIDCSCETLQTLAWLKQRHVSVDDVRCATPSQLHGTSLLLLNERELCDEPTDGDRDIWQDGQNELMQGDQPQAIDVVDTGRDESTLDDELGRDFIPLERKVIKRGAHDEDVVGHDDDDGSGDDVDAPAPDGVQVLSTTVANSGATDDDDGSGDDGETYRPVGLAADETTTTTASWTDDDEDGSGDDGSGLPLLPPVQRMLDEAPLTSSTQSSDSTADTTVAAFDDDDDDNFTPRTLDIFVHHVDEATAEPSPASEHVVERLSNAPNGAAHPHTVTAAERETAESTYIVLTMLAILLLGLIVFVAIRRKKAARSRSNGYDLENGHGKELVDMNRAQPGKPANGNGTAEVMPLIGARDKWDSRIQPGNGLTKPDQEELRRAQEPLLRKLDGDEPGVDDALDGESRRPEARPRSTVSNGGVAPVGQDVPPETNNNGVTGEAPEQPEQRPVAPAKPERASSPIEPQVFQPISPKPARYSPVYSPETGRVKIKLTQTPKPRTPMLVTRHRSNAGDIVTTPVRPAK